jgi:D-beta-D-heptose 7-phosphate kinase/D-beta-D-heptose 1-phosphate adenosyltransferase
MINIVLCTGGFDPVHSGHISYLKHAGKLGDYLIVGLNSDRWLTAKKGRPFMDWNERQIILDNLRMVDRVIDFDDSDGTACNAIRRVKSMFPDDRLIFANGGDRTKENIPEMIFDDVEFVFGIGGVDKRNSSSVLLQQWKDNNGL